MNCFVKFIWNKNYEKNNEINFLDVFIKRLNNNKQETGAYRKPRNTDIYINWNAHLATEWKIETLRNVIKWAKLVCSVEILVNKEMKQPMKVFQEVNEYPMSIINKIAEQVK